MDLKIAIGSFFIELPSLVTWNTDSDTVWLSDFLPRLVVVNRSFTCCLEQKQYKANFYIINDDEEESYMVYMDVICTGADWPSEVDRETSSDTRL